MNTFTHNSGHSVDIDGAKIYFEDIGNKDRPVLLLLHGGLEDIENVNPIASYCTEDFRVIGVDSRGHGKSTLGCQQLTYERVQLDIEALLMHLNIATVNIVGFSDGGIVAYRIAARHKVTVKKLITLGASWSERDVMKAEGMLKSITPDSAREIFAGNFARYQQINPEPDFDTLVQSAVAMWLDTTRTGHPNECVKDISAKTLLIRGDHDFLVSLESLTELQNKIAGSSFMNVPFAEHAVYEEQPQAIEMMLRQFLHT